MCHRPCNRGPRTLNASLCAGTSNLIQVKKTCDVRFGSLADIGAHPAHIGAIERAGRSSVLGTLVMLALIFIPAGHRGAERAWETE
jgi:hypothetical protein